MGIEIREPVTRYSGTWVRRTHVLLTDKTSWAGAASTDEQWGTEETVVDDDDLPVLTDVTVFAMVSGKATNINETGFLGCRVQISVDGGSTWDGTSADLENEFRFPSGTGANLRQMVQASHEVNGATVTGDVMARAIVRNGVGSGSVIDLENGKLHMEVLVDAPLS